MISTQLHNTWMNNGCKQYINGTLTPDSNTDKDKNTACESVRTWIVNNVFEYVTDTNLYNDIAISAPS